MLFDSAKIEAVKILTPKVHRDHRGFFCEVFRDEWLPGFEFVQENLSLSADEGTVRGLHYQKPPMAQAKLVTVLQGAILDVAVDIREGSPTFGQTVEIEVCAESPAQLFIPVGFAHGFCTLRPNTMVLYKVSAPYSPANDSGIHWDDPELGIDWPISRNRAILSDKDRSLPRLREIRSPFSLREAVLT